MADVKWIKITTNIFDDEKILMIESLPSADSIIVIWFKMLTLAGKQNNDGVFIMANRIPYTEEMLACIFRRDINLIRLALKTFVEFGMVEIIDGVITIPNWNKHQTLDAYEKKKERDRLYQAERRKAQKALIDKTSKISSDESSDISSYASVEKSSDIVISDKEEDKEEDKERDKEKGKREKPPYQLIVDMYNETCVSFPRLKTLSEARKKAIKARLHKYNINDFKTLFEKAESSNFLKGSNNRDWSATFDWMIKEQNMVKVLEGNYDDNRGQQKTRSEPAEDPYAYLYANNRQQEPEPVNDGKEMLPYF